MKMTKTTITLTGHPPVTVTDKHWPVVAQADDPYSFETFRYRNLTVRQHADGRAIVYGRMTSAWEGEKNRYAGLMVSDPARILDAIYEVADLLDFPSWLAEDCIADLPAVELD